MAHTIWDPNNDLWGLSVEWVNTNRHPRGPNWKFKSSSYRDHYWHLLWHDSGLCFELVNHCKTVLLVNLKEKHQLVDILFSYIQLYSSILFAHIPFFQCSTHGHISTLPHMLMDLTVLPSFPQHFDWKITSKAIPRGQSSVCTTSVQSQGLHFWRGAATCFDSKEGYLFYPQRKWHFNGVLMGFKWCLDGMLRFRGALMAFWWRFDDRIPLTPSTNGMVFSCCVTFKMEPFARNIHSSDVIVWVVEQSNSQFYGGFLKWGVPQKAGRFISWEIDGNRIYKWIITGGTPMT